MLYLTYVYLLSFIIIGPKLSEKKKMIFAFLPFFIISFLRFGIGADYFSYHRLYQDIGNGSIIQVFNGSSGFEPLFTLVSFIFFKLNISYHIFAGIFTSAISLIFLFWIKDTSKNFEWSVLLFYVMHYPMWNLSALRQGISMAIMFYYLFNEKRDFSNKVKIIAVVVATLFHYASIIVPILYIVSKMKWNKKWFIYLLIAAPIFRILLSPEVMMLFKNVPVIGKFTRYLTGNQVSLLGFTSLVRIFFFFVMYFTYDRLTKRYPSYTYIFNFATLSFLLYLYLPFSTVIATRLTVYGYLLTVIIFPMIMDLYEGKKTFNLEYKKIVIIGLSTFSLLSFYNEFDKMRERTGFIGNLSELNKVTIFNGSYNDFNSKFSLLEQIRKSNEISIENNPLIENSNTMQPEINAVYSDEDEYIIAGLPALNLRVIINNKGEIYEVVEDGTSINIIENIKEVLTPGNIYTKHYEYRYLSTNHLVSIDNIEDILSRHYMKNYTFNKAAYDVFDFDLDLIKDSSLFTEYNLLPVKISNIYIPQMGEGFRYLEIKSAYENYYALLSKEDKVLIPKWYSQLIPQEGTGFIIGYTQYTKEYINSDGKVIWIEKLH